MKVGCCITSKRIEGLIRQLTLTEKKDRASLMVVQWQVKKKMALAKAASDQVGGIKIQIPRSHSFPLAPVVSSLKA